MEYANRPPTSFLIGGRFTVCHTVMTGLPADPRRGVLTRSAAARAGLINRRERHFQKAIVLTLRRALHFLAYAERAAGISLDRAERNCLTRVRRRGAGKLHRSIGRKVRAGDGDHWTGSLPLNGDADLQRRRCLCTYGHRQRDKAQPEQDGRPHGRPCATGLVDTHVQLLKEDGPHHRAMPGCRDPAGHTRQS